MTIEGAERVRNMEGKLSLHIWDIMRTRRNISIWEFGMQYANVVEFSIKLLHEIRVRNTFNKD